LTGHERLDVAGKQLGLCLHRRMDNKETNKT
jgi:hypothetical protein